MQIKTDKQGADAIRALCDIALKSGGMANLAGITQVLACLDYPGRKMPIPTKPEPGKLVPVPKKVQKRGKVKKKKKG